MKGATFVCQLLGCWVFSEYRAEVSSAGDRPGREDRVLDDPASGGERSKGGP
jgi:hypothetical protein